jgi:hypothetical protein
VESRFGPFGDSVSVDAILVHGLRRMYYWLRNLVLVLLEIVLILTEDRCAVCVERTIGSEIVMDAPDGSPR